MCSSITAEIGSNMNSFDFANLPTELLYKIFDQYVSVGKSNCASVEQRSPNAYKRMLPLRLLNRRLGSIVESYIRKYAPIQKSVIAEANFIEPNEIVPLQPLIRMKPFIDYKDGPLKFVGSNVLKRLTPMIDERNVNFTFRMHKKNASQCRSKCTKTFCCYRGDEHVVYVHFGINFATVDSHCSKDDNQFQTICAHESCPRRVAVAISGGVDSAVSALILKKRGYNVLGIHMINWDQVEEGENSCPRTRDQADAESLCRRLGIQFHVVNFVKEYWNEVFLKLIAGYERGETLVPDIECNRVLKFGILHDYVRNQLDIDVVATGHYAQNSLGNLLEHPNRNFLTARDPFKDQTFFLSTLSTNQLKRSMFPIGGMMKPDVKKMADENGLTEFATKAESMGICFVGKKRNFAEFLEKYIQPKAGPIVEIESGVQIGEHRGVHLYTLGKRVSIDPLVYPNHDGVFVRRCDSTNNILYVCLGSFHPSLYAKVIRISDLHWISPDLIPNSKTTLQFRCQRTHPVVNCDFETTGDNLATIRCQLPVRAAAPGQSCVFYRDNVCLGCAKIVDVLETL
ncbi:TRNA-5-taurinomethyluridine 2-sulfurtransferase [Aphelenchoides besseyi]|nr:TRNA-5-taurinomethyluridine 2-sulfurtransferase [Aphelenchoides besseyi]